MIQPRAVCRGGNALGVQRRPLRVRGLGLWVTVCALVGFASWLCGAGAVKARTWHPAPIVAPSWAVARGGSLVGLWGCGGVYPAGRCVTGTPCGSVGPCVFALASRSWGRARARVWARVAYARGRARGLVWRGRVRSRGRAPTPPVCARGGGGAVLPLPTVVRICQAKNVIQNA